MSQFHIPVSRFLIVKGLVAAFKKENLGTEQLREGSLAALECASVGLLMKRRVCLYCVYPPICHAASHRTTAWEPRADVLLPITNSHTN